MLSLLLPSGQIVLSQNTASGKVVFESCVEPVRFASVRYPIVSFQPLGNVGDVRLTIIPPERTRDRFATLRYAPFRFTQSSFYLSFAFRSLVRIQKITAKLLTRHIKAPKVCVVAIWKKGSSTASLDTSSTYVNPVIIKWRLLFY